MEILITAIGSLLTLLPDVVAKAFTGGRTVKEATDDARKAAEAVPVLEADGIWDKADNVRKERG